MLEGTFGDYVVHFPAQTRANFEVRSTLLRALSSQDLSISKDKMPQPEQPAPAFDLPQCEEFFPNYLFRISPAAVSVHCFSPFPSDLQEPVFSTTIY